MNKLHLSQLSRLLILIGIVICSYFLLAFTIPYVYPIILAILFAYLINPIVDFLQNRVRLPRPLSSIFTIFGIFVSLIGLLYIIFLEIYQGTLFLAEKVPLYFKDFIHYIVDFFHNTIIPIQEKILSLFLTLEPSQQLTIKNSLDELMNDIAITGSSFLQDVLSNLPKILTSLPSSITITIFIILGTFLISNDWYFLKNKAQKAIPMTMNTSTKKIGIQLKKALGGFIKAQIIIISMSGAIIFIGLLFLGVDHALTIATFSALVDLIPFIGTGIIFVPWIIYLFIGGDYALTIGLSILYMIVIISRQFLEPKILSANVGVHPLVALIGYYIGFKVWGVLGLIIAPSILILINVFNQTGTFKWILSYIKG